MKAFPDALGYSNAFRLCLWDQDIRGLELLLELFHELRIKCHCRCFVILLGQISPNDDDDDDDINLCPGNLSSNLPKGIGTC